MDRAAQVLELAREEGFDLAGIAPLRPPRDAARFERWLDAGHHADMRWLERNRERITDPRRVLPEGKSILVVGSGHARPAVRLAGGGKVARYAAGRDYHNVLGRRLRRLTRRLEESGLARRARTIVDAGPLLERSHAAEAGLGFLSRAANLLHPRFGPWFFLGELLLDVELSPTPTPPAGSCGTCTACIDACPTAAIREPGLVDANLCLSYHTIENRGVVPHALRRDLGEWVFGCDVCSEVCPWGSSAPDASDAWGTHPSVREGRLVDWLRRPPERFAEDFSGSPLRRPHREGLARNAALALGNARLDEGQSALLASLEEDPSPLVREACFWALSAGYGADAGVGTALARAWKREPDPEARMGMRHTRAQEESMSRSPNTAEPVSRKRDTAAGQDRA